MRRAYVLHSYLNHTFCRVFTSLCGARKAAQDEATRICGRKDKLIWRQSETREKGYSWSYDHDSEAGWAIQSYVLEP